jgi:uncharacterized protein (DUF362 family)
MNPMKRYSRREFLRFGGIALGAMTLGEWLAACGQALLPSSTATPAATLSPTLGAASTSLPTPAQLVAASPSPNLPATQATATASATAQVIPDLVVVHGPDPESMVRAALSALGGMQRFMATGANVIIKPNMCTDYPYQYAATTNPWVVAGLVRLCLEAGAASVRVMDFPFASTAEAAYTSSGIRQQVEAAGGQMAYMSPLFRYVSTPIPAGIELKSAKIYEDILKADLLINVPIAKDHSSTRLTLGMKNLMGVVTTADRTVMHGNLGQRIADLTSLIRPKLTVVDAVRILVADGPTGGGNLNNVKELDTVIASQDIVAADSYATTLFAGLPNFLGLQPKDIGYIAAATAMGLGRSDLQNLNIQDTSISA